ncbi:unnamed protein product [Calicophoron daubneyi]|uniref:Uncharacterized protein n=1 Tax=Calicophoron daubneyi TaxID=300641 RepID=A0AAV2TQM5_CALDB
MAKKIRKDNKLETYGGVIGQVTALVQHILNLLTVAFWSHCCLSNHLANNFFNPRLFFSYFKSALKSYGLARRLQPCKHRDSVKGVIIPPTLELWRTEHRNPSHRTVQGFHAPHTKCRHSGQGGFANVIISFVFSP